MPAEGLAFTFAMTYLDPLFDKFTKSSIGDLTGIKPAGIPEFNISTSATYSHDFGSSGNRLITRIDFNHQSNTKINNGLPTFGANNFRREVNLVNASTTLALGNGLELGLWARNLLNDRYILTVFDGVAQQGTVSGYPSPPRTYGAVARFKF
jgi:outer membrane receptor protein involved in Fe transport